MQNDYYAFQKEQLSNSLRELEQGSIELKEAKKQKDSNDSNIRKQASEHAEAKIKQAAKKAVDIEPHLSYLWYEVIKTDLKNHIRDSWQKSSTGKKILLEKIVEDFQFIPKISDIENLPTLSFMLSIPFKLQKPYLSKDDCSFYLVDNPVRKDKVFQTPMVASTSWKGALRSALLQQLAEWWCNIEESKKNNRSHRKQFLARRISIGRLFGNEKDVQINDKGFENYLDDFGDKKLAVWYRRYTERYISSTGFFSGRLYFYPTFFYQTCLEVINRHDRKTGVGESPILLECVPIGETGQFTLLYVPFNLIKPDAIAADLQLVAEGVEKMLTVYGFGAKTSSGFGIAQINGMGELAIRADLSDLKQPDSELISSESKLPEYLIAVGQLHPNFQNPDGTFKTQAQYKAFLNSQNKNHNKKLYKEAKEWVETKDKKLAEPEPKKLVTKLSFSKLDSSSNSLCDRAKEMAKYLCNGVQA